MARRTNDREHELDKVQRTRAGRLWLMLVPALVFLIVLIVFVAENGQRVEVKFFGAEGHISLALALLASAVIGAVLVLLIGSIRIVQLRLATRRHRRSDARLASAPAPSAAPSSAGVEVEAVEAERDADHTRP